MKNTKKGSKQKTALITGVTGQDGSYLAEFLVNKGYKVYGLIRRVSTEPLLRIGELVFSKKIKLLTGNLRDLSTVRLALEESRPDEIYNLAAQSDVGISFQAPDETTDINYYGVGRIVNEAMRLDPKIRIYQASTSEMFGRTKPPHNERSPFQPVSPYAEAKLKAHEDFVVGYRKKHGLFICSGILFNHESPRRGKHFVTRKITHSLSKIKYGLQDVLTLGNLDAKRDWGYAGDYVEAMWLMLQQNKPDDYVIATGQSHSVREFVDAAAKALSMTIAWKGGGLNEVGVDGNGKTIIRVSKNNYRPNEVHYLKGDSSRARKKLGWKPKVSFGGLVKLMVEADEREIRFGKAYKEFI
jgi:GDPmannose 4,6-dehydratase